MTSDILILLGIGILFLFLIKSKPLIEPQPIISLIEPQITIEQPTENILDVSTKRRYFTGLIPFDDRSIRYPRIGI